MEQVVGAAPTSARARILSTACDLFYREGIRAVGIEAVVAAARTTKMSLYRHFSSKDELVGAYVAERVDRFWTWFDGVLARHPDDPRAQILALFTALAKRTSNPGFRGCPMTNAAIEFPDPDHPGRKVAEQNKRDLHRRLLDLARAAGAREPEQLADAFLLLFEGCYASSQTFAGNGPSRSVALIAATLLTAHGVPAPAELVET